MIRDGHHHPLETEGGHVSFPPGTPEEIRILEHLSSQFGRVSNERLICGPGLVNLAFWFKRRWWQNDPA